MFVEVVRLLIVLLATEAGYELAPADAVIAGSLLGAATGYVVGGGFGRFISRALGRLERRSERLSTAELAIGALGGVAAGLFGMAVGIPALLLLPGLWGLPVLLLTVWIGGVGGFKVGANRGQVLGASWGGPVATSGIDRLRPGDGLLLDGSVLVDGRVVALARQGFLRSDLVVPRGVLDGLALLETAESAGDRRRGRRGLDSLEALTADPRVRIHVAEGGEVTSGDVDAELLALARSLGTILVTVDEALGSLARSEGVPVLDLQRAEESLAPQVHVGENVDLTLTKAGREPGQGIGYLDDGSMVVVGDAADLVGDDVRVEIVSSVRTSVGRMFFAELSGSRTRG